MTRRQEAKAVAVSRERRERGMKLLWTTGVVLMAAAAIFLAGKNLAAAEEPEITVDQIEVEKPVDKIIDEAREEAGTETPSEASGHKLYRRGLYGEALKEWQRASDAGDMGATFRLGEEYFDAKVVKRDVEKAVDYYKKAAEGGEPRAQMDLATLYDNGWGVERDISQAAKWYLAAAQQGMVEAQYNVATLYEKGDGVPLDLEKAYMFYMLAVDGGFPQFATGALENISRMMSPTQIKDATSMARSFQPRTWEEIQSSGG